MLGELVQRLRLCFRTASDKKTNSPSLFLSWSRNIASPTILPKVMQFLSGKNYYRFTANVKTNWEINDPF